MSKTKTLNDIQETPILYKLRMKSETVTIDIGTEKKVEFDLKPLSSRIFRYVQSQITVFENGNTDEILGTDLFVKFGISDIRYLVDSDGNSIPPAYETLSVLGKDVKCLTDDFVEEELPIDWKSALLLEIVKLSGLTNQEQIKLGFIGN